MSKLNTKEREPLLSDDMLYDKYAKRHPMSVYTVRDIYEAARAKDAELIGRLLKALGQLDVWDPDIIQTIEDAKAAGFTPTEQ